MHDPGFSHPDDYTRWFARLRGETRRPKVRDVDRLAAMLQRYPASEMEADPESERPECLQTPD